MKTVLKKVILSLKGRIQILLEEQTSVKTENLLPLMYLNLTTSIKIKINEMKFYINKLTFHLLPHSMQNTKVVIGSSELLVCSF